MQKLIRMFLDAPIAVDRDEIKELDEKTTIKELHKAETDVKTRIILQIGLDAMKGDRQCAEFLFKYGGLEPIKEQEVTMNVPTIIDDMAPAEKTEEFVPPEIYNDPDESEDD